MSDNPLQVYAGENISMQMLGNVLAISAADALARAQASQAVTDASTALSQSTTALDLANSLTGSVDTAVSDASTALSTANEAYSMAESALASAFVSQGQAVEINAQTGTAYEFVLTDAGKLVTGDNANPIVFTVPTNATVAFPVGTVIALQQLGAGAISVEGDTGVTINGTDPGSESLTDAQYLTTAALTKHATDTWTLTGAVEHGS